MRQLVMVTVLCSLTLVGCSGGGSRDSGSGVPIIGDILPRAGSFVGSLNPFSRRGGRSREAEGRLCGVRGIEGERIPAITSSVEGCGVAEPVRVTRVDGVRLTQAAILDCETAEALHTWVRRGVRPAVGRTGGGVEGLRVAAHYVCRPMNHRPGARISEHGRGRAIDISAILLENGDEMNVLSDWRGSRHSRALRSMHGRACGIFGTTLGPGSDGFHEDHFHYDTARHGTGPICR